jgi:hypothetical protein
MRLHQHEVVVLDGGPARQLFRRAARLDGGLHASLQMLEEAILRICGGLPLALLLLGGQLLQDTNVASWQVMPGSVQRGAFIGLWFGAPQVPPLRRCSCGCSTS